MAKKQVQKSVTVVLEDTVRQAGRYSLDLNLWLMEQGREVGTVPSPSKLQMPDIPELDYEGGTYVEKVLLGAYLELLEALDEVGNIEAKLARNEGSDTIQHSLDYLRERIEGARVRAYAGVASTYPLYRLGEQSRQQQLRSKRTMPLSEFEKWVKQRGGIPRPGTAQYRPFIVDAAKRFKCSERTIERRIRAYRNGMKGLYELIKEV